MQTKNWFRALQLFAAGGEGGAEGAATGVTAGDAGQPTGVTADAAGQQAERDPLEALGVPRELAAKHRALKARKGKAAPTAAESEPKAEEQAAAAPEETEEAQPSQRMTWDEIMADPEYKAEMSKIVQARTKSAKEAQTNLDKLAPMLEMLAGHYNVDVADLDAIAKAVTDDDQYYEQKAMELGVPKSTAKRMAQLEAEQARRNAQDAAAEKERLHREHFAGLQAQFEKLREVYPEASLEAELQNPDFVRMTSPGVNVPVETAYYAVHRREIQAAQAKAVAQQTASRVSRSIQSGQGRPVEHGASAQAPSVQPMSYRSMSKEQRAEFKRRWKSGEKVFG